MKVYLSGGIYKDDSAETTNWRAFASARLLTHNIHTIDPCRNKLTYDASKFTPKEIVTRDHADISRCDLLLINGNPKGDHLSIGTWCELERAHSLGKPVVVFSTDERVINHPWVVDYSAKIFETLHEALSYIIEYWRE